MSAFFFSLNGALSLQYTHMLFVAQLHDVQIKASSKIFTPNRGFKTQLCKLSFFFFKCHIKTNVNFNIDILIFCFCFFCFSRNYKHIGEELWKSAWLPSSLPLKFSKFKKKEEKAVWLIKFSLCPSLPARKSRKRKPVSIVAATPVRMREVGERSVQLMCIPRSIVWKCHPDCCSNNTTASYWKRAGQTASPMCYVFFIFLFFYFNNLICLTAIRR